MLGVETPDGDWNPAVCCDKRYQKQMCHEANEVYLSRFLSESNTARGTDSVFIWYVVERFAKVNCMIFFFIKGGTPNLY